MNDSKRNDDERMLHNIVVSFNRLESHLSEFNTEVWEKDIKMQDAVMYCLYSIAYHINRTSKELKEKYPTGWHLGHFELGGFVYDEDNLYGMLYLEKDHLLDYRKEFEDIYQKEFMEEDISKNSTKDDSILSRVKREKVLFRNEYTYSVSSRNSIWTVKK